MQIPANAMLFFFLLGLTARMMEFKGEKGEDEEGKEQTAAMSNEQRGLSGGTKGREEGR